MNRPTDSDRPGAQTRPERANPLSDPAFRAGLRPIPSGRLEGSEQRPAADIVGLRPSGNRIEVRIDQFDEPVLLCFLHIRCEGCVGFWRGLGDGVGDGLSDGVSAVAVTKGPGSVDPSEVERAAAGIGRVPVVMSEEAWADYRVSGYPFFVLVDSSTGVVIGETVGFGWSDVRSMIEASLP
jgi:hypothetical protein